MAVAHWKFWGLSKIGVFGQNWGLWDPNFGRFSCGVSGSNFSKIFWKFFPQGTGKIKNFRKRGKKYLIGRGFLANNFSQNFLQKFLQKSRKKGDLPSFCEKRKFLRNRPFSRAPKRPSYSHFFLFIILINKKKILATYGVLVLASRIILQIVKMGKLKWKGEIRKNFRNFQKFPFKNPTPVYDGRARDSFLTLRLRLPFFRNFRKCPIYPSPTRKNWRGPKILDFHKISAPLRFNLLFKPFPRLSLIFTSKCVTLRTKDRQVPPWYS